MEALDRLCEQFEVETLYVFGSRAQEAFRFVSEGQAIPPDARDLDIGVLPRRPLSVRQKITLTLALEDILDVPRVDLVVLPEDDSFLAANIIRGERIYARYPHQADEYELYILRRAGDLIPLERERLALLAERRS
ncbi:MAG: nucleotidyltransferase domain-containing protein [Anaerolineae bacterium]|nr:nucleotidyltransferase domain-containing protein [Anaerolineae bacterium]MDW8098045.1 nucleotidyltransferase domain-containing protein [Anaerolineae bacterium]